MEPTFQDDYEREFIERDAQYPADLRPAGDNIAETQSLGDMSASPAGEPNLKYDVRSTFDSRPVNGYDFNITSKHEFHGNSGSPQSFTCFQVPQGYVAIPRGWYVQFYPVPLITDLDGVLFTPQLDGADISYNIDVPIGVISDQELTGFFVADEFQKVGFRVTSALTFPGNPSAYNMSVRVYGNLLLKDNIPAQFQVANRCDTCGGIARVAGYTQEAPAAITRVDRTSAAPPGVIGPPPPPVIIEAPPPAPLAPTPKCPPNQIMWNGKCTPCAPGAQVNAAGTGCVQTIKAAKSFSGFAGHPSYGRPLLGSRPFRRR